MFSWNDRKILPPPIHTFYCTGDVDITNVRYICEDITRVLTKQSPLHQESAILSRFIYKFDKKFRNDLGYRKLKKINTCLRRYLELNLIKVIETFKSSIPTDKDNLYLPTRQMLEYVLVRIVSFSMIMLKIFVVSKQAAIFYMDRIKRGESFWMSLLPYASICRIWSISSVLLQHSCKWYQKLFIFLDSLDLKGVPFLNNESKLPNDLKVHLKLDEINDFGRFNWSVNKIVNIESILNENEVDESFDLLKYVQDINCSKETEELIEEPCVITTTPQEANSTAVKKIDKGQVVSRDFLISKSEPAETKISNIGKELIHDHLAVKTTENLKSFITNEDNYRNFNSKISLTSHLSFMQWQSLKHSLTAITNLNKNKMLKKFKVIWKEKCLDYL